MSLRVRLLAGMVALVAAGLTIAAIITYEEQRSFLYTRLHQQVLSLAGPALARAFQLEPAGVVVRRRPVPPHDLTGARPPAILPPGTFGELLDAAGRVVRRRTFSYDGRISPYPRLPAHFPVDRAGARPRVFALQAPDGTGYIAAAFALGRETAVAAVPTREVDQTLQRLILVEALVGAGVILALVALGWLVIRLGLRPLERIGRVASEIAGGDLSRRVSPDDPRTEVGQLGRSLNEMLAQVEHAFEDRRRSEDRLRAFLADASHELRTPLAAIRGYAELYRMGAVADAETLELTMARIEAESARMGTLVEDLLLLAQLDRAPEARRGVVDLAELASHSVQDARAIAPDRRITLTGPEALLVAGDPDRLRQLVANIVGNALIHTPAGTPVEVELATDGEGARLTVSDHGPGIPEGRGEAVFERFWRDQAGRHRGPGGAGLGLAIAQAIAAVHGGRIRAETGDRGGARFVVDLPALSQLSASSHRSLSEGPDSSPAMSDASVTTTPGRP